MKKRSLFAAVAMLIVSAIVLTSTTYAWFTLANAANTAELQASVAQQSGLSISADDSTYSNYLSEADICKGNGISHADPNDSSVTVYAFNGTLVPVDYNPAGYSVSGSTVNWSKMSSADTENNTITTTTATASGADGVGDYYKFNLYIQGEADKTVVLNQGTSTTVSKFVGTTTSVTSVGYINIQFNETPGTQGSSATDHIFCATSGTNDSYKCLNGLKTAAPMVNSIVTDSNHVVATAVTGTQSSSLDDLEIPLDSTGKASLVVYIWIEGQDSNCISTNFQGGDLKAQFYFGYKPDTQQGGGGNG